MLREKWLLLYPLAFSKDRTLAFLGIVLTFQHEE